MVSLSTSGPTRGCLKKISDIGLVVRVDPYDRDGQTHKVEATSGSYWYSSKHLQKALQPIRPGTRLRMVSDHSVADWDRCPTDFPRLEFVVGDEIYVERVLGRYVLCTNSQGIPKNSHWAPINSTDYELRAILVRGLGRMATRTRRDYRRDYACRLFFSILCCIHDPVSSQDFSFNWTIWHPDDMAKTTVPNLKNKMCLSDADIATLCKAYGDFNDRVRSYQRDLEAERTKQAQFNAKKAENKPKQEAQLETLRARAAEEPLSDVPRCGICTHHFCNMEHSYEYSGEFMSLPVIMRLKCQPCDDSHGGRPREKSSVCCRCEEAHRSDYR